MGRFADQLAGAGNIQGHLTRNVDEGAEEGRRQQQSAQLGAMREQHIKRAALARQLQEDAAGAVPQGVMGAPNIQPGRLGVYNEPTPPPPPDPMGGFSGGKEIAQNPYDAPHQPTLPGLPQSSTAQVPPGFTQPPPQVGGPAQTPKRTPYGANGRGLQFSFAPPLGGDGNAHTPSQGDVRAFDNATNPPPTTDSVSGAQVTMPAPQAPAVTQALPQPGSVEEAIHAAAQQYGIPYEVAYALAQHESNLNPDAYNLNRNGTNDSGLFQINSIHLGQGPDQRADPRANAQMGARIFSQALRQAQQLNGTAGQPPTMHDYQIAYQIYNGGAGGYQSPQAVQNGQRFAARLGTSMSPGAPQSPAAAAPATAPAAVPTMSSPSQQTAQGPAEGVQSVSSPAQAGLSHNLPIGQQFYGGEQGGQEHYGYYDNLAAQQAKMAQIHMLAGDPDRANQAMVQANMARLEQYNILSGQALNAARRGDPTQLLSLMNFYDPNAGYSIRGLRNGAVEVLTNGQVIGQMAQNDFLDKAQMMTSKAYYDQMTALKAKIYQKYAETGIETQGKLAVADVEGRWKVAVAEKIAASKGLHIVPDSGSGKVFAYDDKGNMFIYKEGVAIGGTQWPTAGEFMLVGRQQ